jgi:NitT/TauT family transport system permease protein
VNYIKKIQFSRTLYGVFMVILLWYVLHFVIRSAIIPSPHKTIINFIRIFPRTLFLHLLASLGRIAAAVVFSIVAGVTAGLLIGMNKRIDRLVSPVIYILYPIPKVAFVPLFMILFGLGNLSKVIMIMSIILFQIIVTSRDAVKELTKEMFYSARSLGMNRLQLYRHLVIPAVLPKIITAVRISVGTSIAVLFYGENFATTYGIGYFIMNSWSMVNYTEMFSGILGLSLLGYILFKVIDLMESRFCGWVKA